MAHARAAPLRAPAPLRLRLRLVHHRQLLTRSPPRAQLRYANNSNYKNDTIIRKEVYVSPAVLAEVKRIVQESEARACAATPRPPLRRRPRRAARSE